MCLQAYSKTIRISEAKFLCPELPLRLLAAGKTGCCNPYSKYFPHPYFLPKVSIGSVSSADKSFRALGERVLILLMHVVSWLAD